MSDDLVTLRWLDGERRLVELTVTLDQAAALERGEPVCGRGLVQRWSLEDLAAAKRAALDELAAVERDLLLIELRHLGIG